MAADTLIGAVIDERFEIRDKLGQGGMGTVYRAWQRSIGREVAIKLIDRQMSKDPTWVERFLREARLASQLSHPNTISVFDSGQMPDGRLFTAMELLRGRTLGKVLNTDGAFPLARVVRIGTQICDALEAAHALRIVHRDLKLENVMILDQGADLVKVLDFGLAKALDDKTTTATMAGVVLGTPGYIPPEGAMTGESSPASDLYALGVILAELSLAAHLWEGKHLGLILQQQLDPAQTLARLQQPLRNVVARLLDPKPTRRPTAAEARALLMDALAGKVVAPEPEAGATVPMKKASAAEATAAQPVGQAMATVPDQRRQPMPNQPQHHQPQQPMPNQLQQHQPPQPMPNQPPRPSASDLATTLPHIKSADPRAANAPIHKAADPRAANAPSHKSADPRAAANAPFRKPPRSGVRTKRTAWPLIGAGAAAFVASIVIAYVATRESAPAGHAIGHATTPGDAGVFDKLATAATNAAPTTPTTTSPLPTTPSPVPTTPSPVVPDKPAATDDVWSSPIVEAYTETPDTVTIKVIGIPDAAEIRQGDIKGPIVTSPFELARGPKWIWFAVMKDRELVTSRYITPDRDQTVDFTPTDLRSCKFGSKYKAQCLALFCRANPDVPECKPGATNTDAAPSIKDPFRDDNGPPKKPKKSDTGLERPD